MSYLSTFPLRFFTIVVDPGGGEGISFSFLSAILIKNSDALYFLNNFETFFKANFLLNIVIRVININFISNKND